MKMILNPDKELVEQIKEDIKNNNGYCPCIIDRSENSKCPCLDFRTYQLCHCNLYIEGER